VRASIDWTNLIEKAALPVELYLRATAKTISVQVLVEDHGGFQRVPPEELDAVIGQVLSLPTLLPFWNAHSLLLLAAYLRLPPLQQRARTFEAAADNSAGGLLTQALYQRLGLVGRRLSLTSPEERLSDLKALFLQMPTLAIASDSHGPYRSISTGMARIARQYGDNVRPVSAVTSRSLQIFRHIKMAAPLPLSMVAVAIGAPVSAATLRQPIATMCKALEEILSTLEANLETALQQRYE
jgi:lysophospholipid acyltransferase (LPLAT)-like uncharacterized protein